jgi:diacylglycerol O-acyltransferase / wax synthase
MTSQRFSNLDTLMLRMDNPVDPVVVTGMLVLGAPIDIGQLKATIETRILRFNRLRQRVVPSRLPWRAPSWKDAVSVDLDYHVQRVILPPPGDQAALQRTVSVLIGIPLDMNRPPWQMHLVETYGSGSVLICRAHHSLADGVALVHVILSLADAGAADPLDPPDSPSDPEQQDPPPGPDVIQRPQGRTRRRPVRRLMRRGPWTLSQFRRVPELIQLARDTATVASDLILSPPDADTVFRGMPSLPKSIAWSEPVPLEEIKTIGQRLDGTVNDVLLAALAGALQRYLQLRQDLRADVSLRAIIPINRRPLGAEAELGNRITAVFLPLPLDIADPAERLAELKRRMDGLKDSMQPAVVLAGLEVVSRAPSMALALALGYLSSKATVIVTNVKGPQDRLYLLGAPVEEIMAWIPRYGGIGIGISILSYAGQVRLGVVSDDAIVPDPENIMAGFRDEVDTLLALALALEAKRPSSMRGLLDRLDAALVSLDDLVSSRTDKHGSL